MRKIFLGALLLTLLWSCEKEGKLPPINNKVDLDGPLINDSSLIQPERFLLSAATTSATPAELAQPVIITAHGYSASNFEWLEFSEYMKSKGIKVSRVLLGGHGRDYADFKKATWHDWQVPIIEEYNKLVALGYRNISMAGSSTGGPLLLEMLMSKRIDISQLKNIFLIDPIVIPSNKILTLAPVVGGTVIDYTTSELDKGEEGYWYKYRPQESLRQLNKLTQHVRKQLEGEATFPATVKLYVWHDNADGAADPGGSAAILKGVPAATVTVVESQLHVFTRLKGRAQTTPADYELQTKTFNAIYEKVR